MSTDPRKLGFVLLLGALAGCDRGPWAAADFQLPDREVSVEPVSVAVSDGRETVRAVEFRLDGTVWAVDHEPPFEAELDPSAVPGEGAELEVVAATWEGSVSTRRLELRRAASSPPAHREDRGVAPPPTRGRVWQAVELELSGPPSHAMDSVGNPFLLRVDVVFEGPDTVTIPAFFDGDGEGGLAGSVWKARFSPPAPGLWRWHSVSADEPTLHGQGGSIEVEPAQQTEDPFSHRGPLRWAGEHYLRFASGERWVKGGADDPEDFLGNRYLPTRADKLAALDELERLGVNSLYVITQNIRGDGRNVWPWVGATEQAAMENHRHFDLKRLRAWEELFTAMQRRGIVIHLVLEDDAGWPEFDRELYYREMVARFGHHNGLIWNLAEEFQENYSPAEIKRFAAALDSLDVYDHAITVHHHLGLDSWEPFLGDPHLDLTSFQTDKTPQYLAAAEWYGKTTASGRVIPVSFDETGKLHPTDRELARRVAWSVYLGGANYEVHTWPIYSGGQAFDDGVLFEGDHDYADFAPLFEDMTRARRFVESLPLERMAPLPDVGRDPATTWVMGDPGELYVVYLAGTPGAELDLGAVAAGPFELRWLDPSTGASVGEPTVVSPAGALRLENPRAPGDAVATLSRTGTPASVPRR